MGEKAANGSWVEAMPLISAIFGKVGELPRYLAQARGGSWSKHDRLAGPFTAMTSHLSSGYFINLSPPLVISKEVRVVSALLHFPPRFSIQNVNK